MNKIKKLLAGSLALCLLLTCVPMYVFATTQEDAELPVIPEDAIYLSAPEDLLALAENCVSDAWSRGKTVILENDIDLSGVAFEPIPTFGGTFLGQDYVISGLDLHKEQSVVGFFRYLQKGAVVENLHLKGAVQPAKSGNLSIGTIAGVNNGTIRGCSFSGSVAGNEQVGGIVGRNKVTGVIEDCSVSGMVSGDHYIGGICGENQGVIRYCSNNAEVNTRVEQNSLTMDVLSGISLESLTSRESNRDATNIGGIVGTSSGVIRGCENRADIGYEKMGYNVGGIAGSQIGFITESVNYGTINGSDGVGGIVGQFKPNVVLEFGPNPIDTMTAQMSGMMNAMSGLMSSMSDMMGTMNMDMSGLKESLEVLKDPENWDADSIGAAVNEMTNSFNTLYNNMSSMGSGMTDQMSSMMSSMNGMVSTMQDLGKGLDITIIDVSKSDTPENNVTKVSYCENYGDIYGENYVGGITGIADVEDTTAKDEVEGQVSFSNEGEVTMRLVIRSCKNSGKIVASKEYAGGIIGNMTIGAVFESVNTGNLDSLNANYVGGIAGCCDAFIGISFSRSILAGNDYVGGIAGFGTEIMGCTAISDIAAGTKYTGSILGYTENLPEEDTSLISGNFYLDNTSLGGIDGVSYENATTPVALSDLLAVEGLPEELRTANIRFVVPGQADAVRTVKLGGKLPLYNVPKLTVDADQLYEWEYRKPVTAKTLGMNETEEIYYLSEARLTDILFDQTYEAVFDAKNMVTQSESRTENNRSVILAVGAFDKDTTVSLTDRLEKNPTVNGAAVAENWQVTISNIGVEKLHYHIPEGIEPELITLYVEDASGAWTERDFLIEGSYLVFAFDDTEQGFALAVESERSIPTIPVAIAMAAVVLVLLLVKFVKNRKKKEKKARKPLNKKLLLILLAVLVVIAIAVGLLLNSSFFAAATAGSKIAAALEPMLNAQNQSLHIQMNAAVGENPISLDCDMYAVQWEDNRYVILEQEGNSFYITDGLLLLENGNAFRLADEFQSGDVGYQELLPLISALYEVLDITVEESKTEAIYAISVTGAQAQQLMAAAFPMEEFTLDTIDSLQVQLVTKEDRLDRIQLSASAMALKLDAEISDFQVLEEGAYEIPAAVTESYAGVDRDSLFSLTEDLYNLVLALESFTAGKEQDGTVTLSVESDLLTLDNTWKLSQLKGITDSRINVKDLQQLPEMLGTLFVESRLTCAHEGSESIYTVTLDQSTIKKITRLILPELADYTDSLTQGTAQLILADKTITRMSISIDGSINALLAQLPVSVSAVFLFE